MADKKITDLPALTAATANDLLPIVDDSGNVTKKVMVSGLIPDGSISTTKVADAAITPQKRDGGFFGVTHTFTNATGAQTITGIGFTPKAIQVIGIARSSSAEGHSTSGFAFYTGSAYPQGASSVYTAASSPRTLSSTASAFAQTNAAGSAFIFEATVTGFSSDTISVDVVTTNADAGFRSYHIMVFG